MASSTGSTFYTQSMMSSEDFAGDFSAAADQPISRPEQDVFVGNLGRYTQVTLPIFPRDAAAHTAFAGSAPSFCRAGAASLRALLVCLRCNWGELCNPLSGLGSTRAAASFNRQGCC